MKVVSIDQLNREAFYDGEPFRDVTFFKTFWDSLHAYRG